MLTKEEEMQRLARATKILQGAEGLQAEIEKCRISYPLQIVASGTAGNIKTALLRKRKKKHLGIFKTAVIYIVILLILDAIVSNIGEVIIRSIFNYAIFVIAIPITILIRKFINDKRDAKNVFADEHNAAVEKRAVESQLEAQQKIEAIRENRQQLLSRLESIYDVYNREVGYWLDPKYSYSQATDFMWKEMYYGRADSFKEAMNLFDEKLHRQHMEEGQQQIIRNQIIQTMVMSSEMESLRKEIASMPPPVINNFTTNNTSYTQNNTFF